MSAPATVSTADIKAVRAAIPRPDATAAVISTLFPLPDAHQKGNVVVGVTLSAFVVAASSSRRSEQRRGDAGVVSPVKHLDVAKNRFATVRDACGRSFP